MIAGLRSAGDGVVEMNAPIDLDTPDRVRLLREPSRLPVAVGALAGSWVRLIVRSHKEPEPDAVLVGYLGHLDVWLARLLFRRQTIVLDHLVSLAGTAVDRGLAGSGGLKHRVLHAIDRAALRAANVVVVDTQEQADALPAAAAAKAVVVPVGAEEDWFAARATGQQAVLGGPLRVIFFGVFTPLHGTTAIGLALAELAYDDGIDVTMVGTGQDHADCRRLAAPNSRVVWYDWVAREELATMVAGHDVALGIFGASAKAQQVVPTKVYQSAAAGCAIVTSDTPPQQRALGAAAAFVPAGDPTAIAAALRDLAADRTRLAGLRAAAAARADSDFRAADVVRSLRGRLNALSSSQAVARREAPAAVKDLAPLTPRATLRWDVVRRVISRAEPASILEIGCGVGAMGMRLTRYADYTGLEPDYRSFRAAHDRIASIGGTVIHGNHTRLPPRAQFDMVCAFEVLEHIADDTGALVAWLAFVKPGGHLLLSVPSDPERFGPFDVLVGHYRRYTAEQLTERLAAAGAINPRVTHYGWPFGYLLDAIRDMVGGRRTGDTGDLTPEERTSGSGRLLQPAGAAAGLTIKVVVFPWILLQRLRSGRGPGLVVLASRADGAG